MDVFVKVWNRERWGRDIGEEVEHPAEFVRDVLGRVGRGLVGGKGGDGDWEGLRRCGVRELFEGKDGEGVGCRYHDHGGGECYGGMAGFCF